MHSSHTLSRSKYQVLTCTTPSLQHLDRSKAEQSLEDSSKCSVSRSVTDTSWVASPNQQTRRFALFQGLCECMSSTIVFSTHQGTWISPTYINTSTQWQACCQTNQYTYMFAAQTSIMCRQPCLTKHPHLPELHLDCSAYHAARQSRHGDYWCHQWETNKDQGASHKLCWWRVFPTALNHWGPGRPREGSATHPGWQCCCVYTPCFRSLKAGTPSGVRFLKLTSSSALHPFIFMLASMHSPWFRMYTTLSCRHGEISRSERSHTPRNKNNIWRAANTSRSVRSMTLINYGEMQKSGDRLSCKMHIASANSMRS